MNVLFLLGESQDDVRDHAMFCELPYMGLFFSAASLHIFYFKLKEGEMKSTKKTTGKNRF